MKAEEVRDKARYRSKEPRHEFMRKLGFIIKGDSVKNKDEMLSKVYTEEDLAKMGYTKKWGIFHRHFKLNYWETWQLVHYGGHYAWKMYDRFGYG